MSKYFNTKLAKILDLSDIEDEVDYYFTDEQEPMVREKIRDAYAKNIALRHPVLTGIPTFGIWPAIAKGNAVFDIARISAKKYPDVQQSYKEIKKERRLQEASNLQKELDRQLLERQTNAIEYNAYQNNQLPKKK